ncbi:hypothetical protein [Curtobacterium sp. MCBD17_040]|uniref:hypothetical protein n=1 Tax=Curtobacterium sp. MCBD17_040 TaxID=2175674 RepID=UPI000DA7527E|nr:hypothetical protein [Curtobacterium sp. MCBD17_040]WIB65831.1 hypothetical protein DEI94_17100 [Curtobacterium sp. MCBD17_040]
MIAAYAGPRTETQTTTLHEPLTEPADESVCLNCNEMRAAIRASQRTNNPLYCFDGLDEHPHHRFVGAALHLTFA